MIEVELDIANNLKMFRKNAGLSRRALAEKISYSEKSVEKWESGKGYPSVKVLCEIAQILSVPLEKLVYSQSNTIAYALGIDGGGTKTEFLLQDAIGNTVAELTLGSSNPVDIGMRACKALLQEGIEQVCGAIDRRKISVFAGLAGGCSGKNQTYIRQFLAKFNFGRFDNGSDMDNALQLALHGGDGVVVINGTGIIAYVQKSGRCKRIAGWGYLLDSSGSGYNLGRDALEAALRALDGRGIPTQLTALIENQLNKKIPEAIPEIYGGGKRFIARFAPLVFQAYRRGDAAAAAIVERNIAGVAEIIRAAGEYFTERETPVILCGGLSQQKDIYEKILQPSLPEHMRLSFLKEPMVYGAVQRARGK